MTAHYDDDTLLVYLFASENFRGRAELEQHVAACAECRERLASAGAFERGLAAPETWEVAEELRSARQRQPFRGLVRRKRTEDEAAKHLLSAIVEKPPQFAFLNLSRERLQTAGCVRFLCRAAHGQCEINPLHARNLADAAAQLAGSLRDSVYGESAVNLLRASAQCERANALRYLGEFDEGHAAVDRAAALLENTATPPVEDARVDYIRATLFWKQRNFVDGLRLIRRSAEIFAAFGEAVTHTCQSDRGESAL